MINYKTYGVTIGGMHSYTDFGLIMTKKFISGPEAKTNIVEVPGTSDIIDLSEAISGHVEYKPRTIQLEFMAAVEGLDQANKYSKILEAWNGSRGQIIFDDDMAFYWLGRVKTELSNVGRAVTVTVEATVEPYKLDIQTTGEDWLWDPFDFETGYIPEAERIDISGKYEYHLMGRDKRTFPTITVSAPMTVTYKNTTYNLVAGVNKMYEIIISSGEDILEFDGVGTVSVDYRGGIL